MTEPINRVGQRYGLLTVTRSAGKSKNSVRLWECKCDCGNVVTVLATNLISGTSKSCGCLKRDLTIQRSTKHGLAVDGNGKAPKLYRIWVNMRRRCLNEKAVDYKHYGGRGICICPEWDDYGAFYQWAYANGYKEGLTIERKDNNGNYEPSNCRWATRKEQARNTRNCHRVTFNGETKTLVEWAESLGIPYTALRMRLHHGWSIEKALTTPVKTNKSLKEVSGL